ncbi:MAG: hypothetical protein WAU24_07910 [Chitinophagaceae bacterium]
MLLNIVTDDELLTSQVVKAILLCLMVAGIMYNLYRIVRSGSKVNKVINSFFFIFLTVIVFFVIKQFRVEEALLESPVYVQGTTIGYCNVFAEGQGIEFEYEVNGRKFNNCNTFHPVVKDSIIVPGGKYIVRCSKKFPENGRMDFQKTVK